MRDLISIQRAKQLHPKIRQEVMDLIDKVEAGMPSDECIRIVQGVRSTADQTALYAQGRTKPGKIVTNAKPGSSLHEYMLAIDYARMKAGKVIWEKYQPMVDVFKNAGYKWGGDFKSFKDFPHFEKTFGLTLKQVQAKHKAKDFISGTQFINI